MRADAATFAPARGCETGAVHALIGGRHECLRPRRACRARLDARYHRHGFHCHSGRLVRDRWAPLFRRLKFPKVAPGEPCPTTPEHNLSSGSPAFIGARVQGDGPLYASLRAVDGVVSFMRLSGTQYPPRALGWWGNKTSWIARPNLAGRILVRGWRLDGSGPVAFLVGEDIHGGPRETYPRFVTAIRLTLERADDVFSHATLLREPNGCYGLQADGPSFSAPIVFEARRGEG